MRDSTTRRDGRARGMWTPVLVLALGALLFLSLLDGPSGPAHRPRREPPPSGRTAISSAIPEVAGTPGAVDERPPESRPTSPTAIPADDRTICTVAPGDDKEFKYPPIDGFETHMDWVNALQVPADVLDGATPARLVELALTLPVFDDIMFGDTPLGAFDALAEACPVLRRVTTTAGTAAELVARYARGDASAIGADWAIEKQGEYAQWFTRVETLLVQEGVLAQLSKAELRRLTQVALARHAEKVARLDVYGSIGTDSTVLVIGRALSQAGELAGMDARVAEEFLRTGRTEQLGVAGQIVGLARAFADGQAEGGAGK